MAIASQSLKAYASYVPANKLPEIQKPNAAKTDNQPHRPLAKDAPVTTVLPPDVERALKAAGWTTITGVWKKKTEGVYEVTDGKLETAKVNGALQFTVSGPGKVTAFVRNDNRDPWVHSIGGGGNGSGGSGASSSDAGFGHFQWPSGYGVSISDRECKAYTPQGGWANNNDYYPGYDHTTNLAATPKHQVLITVQDKENGKSTALTALVDGKKEVNCNYKLNKDGPFTIEVKGTVILEDPKAAGQ